MQGEASTQQAGHGLGIANRLARHMVIEKDDARVAGSAHPRDTLQAPLGQLGIGVVVIELLLFGAGSPARTIAAMKAEVEQIGVGDQVKRREKDRAKAGRRR